MVKTPPLDMQGPSQILLTLDMLNAVYGDYEGDRQTAINFKGYKGDGTLHTLGSLYFEHDGDGDDQNGKFSIFLNDGDDDDVPSKEILSGTSDGTINVNAIGEIVAEAGVTIDGVLLKDGNVIAQLTQNDANAGPVINAYRTRGAAGQANDYLGVLRFTGKNANATPEDVIYAEVVSQIKDASDSSEVGDLIFKTMRAGTLRESVRVAGSGMITLDKSHIADSVNGNILYMKGENSALYVGSTSSCLNLWGYTSAGGAGAINIDATGARTGQLYLKTNGTVGINTNVPAKRLEVVDPSAAQLRLTHTAGTYYTDLKTDSSGNLTATPVGGTLCVSKIITLSSSADIALPLAQSGIYIFRETTSSGVAAVVFFAYGQTPVILSQAGFSAFVTSAPGADEIRIFNGGNSYAYVRAGTNMNARNLAVTCLVCQI